MSVTSNHKLFRILAELPETTRNYILDSAQLKSSVMNMNMTGFARQHHDESFEIYNEIIHAETMNDFIKGFEKYYDFGFKYGGDMVEMLSSTIRRLEKGDELGFDGMQFIKDSINTHIKKEEAKQPEAKKESKNSNPAEKPDNNKTGKPHLGTAEQEGQEGKTQQIIAGASYKLPIDEKQAAADAGNNSVHVNFGKFVENNPKPAQEESYVPPAPNIVQPPQQQQVIPSYQQFVQDPEGTTQKVVENNKVAQQQQFAQQQMQVPPKARKKGRFQYSIDNLRTMPANEKVDEVHKHFTFMQPLELDLNKPEDMETLDSFMYLITHGLIRNKCKASRINIPDDGPTFTQIPLETYSDDVDLSKFNYAFRVDQMSDDGHFVVVYLDAEVKTGAKGAYISASVFDPNKEETHNH